MFQYDIHAILIEARRLILYPNRWTRGAFARNSRGHEVDPKDGSAEMFDLAGAVFRAAQSNAEMILACTYIELAISGRKIQRLDMKTIQGFNDDPRRRHGDMLQIINDSRRLARHDGYRNDGTH